MKLYIPFVKGRPSTDAVIKSNRQVGCDVFTHPLPALFIGGCVYGRAKHMYDVMIHVIESDDYELNGLKATTYDPLFIHAMSYYPITKKIITDIATTLIEPHMPDTSWKELIEDYRNDNVKAERIGWLRALYGIMLGGSMDEDLRYPTSYHRALLPSIFGEFLQVISVLFPDTISEEVSKADIVQWEEIQYLEPNNPTFKIGE